MSARLPASLYMDDATLLAKSKSGLADVATTYVEFCRKFRMWVNAKKSVVMHFTKKDIADSFVIETECGVYFSSPKPKDGKLSHKHLGFMLGSKLCGSSHLAKMKSTYMSELSKVEEVYKVTGESMALLYLSSTAGPKTRGLWVQSCP